MPEPTVFKFPAIWRRDAYTARSADQQAEYVQRMQREPDFLYRELLAITVAKAGENGSVHPAGKPRRVYPTAARVDVRLTAPDIVERRVVVAQVSGCEAGV